MYRGRNQRLQDRFPIPETEDFSGLLRSTRTDAKETRIVDLSLSGAALVVDQPRILRISHGLNLGLRWRERMVGVTPIEPVHMREVTTGQSSTHVVGVRFQSQNEPFLQELCHFILETHSQTPDQPRFVSEKAAFTILDNPKRIAGLFAYCIRNQVELKLFELTGRPLGRVYPRGVDGDAAPNPMLVGHLKVHEPGVLKNDLHYYLVLQTFTCLYIIQSPFLGGTIERAHFGIPSKILEGGFRRLGRVWLDEDDPITLEFVHPQIPGRFIRKQAREAGLGGMSFPLRVQEDVLVKGTVINSAVLRLPEGRSLPCRCVVRHTLRGNDGQFFCGVEFQEFAGSGRQTWVEHLLGRMNPEVKIATPFTLDDVWEVLARTGYLEEKPAHTMQRLKKPFLEVWEKLSSNHGTSRCWLLKHKEDALGTICMSRIYSQTWLIHQLAVDMDRFEDSRQKLVIPTLLIPRTIFQWIAGIYPAGNVLAYLDATNPFNQWAWFRFFARHEGSGIVLQRLTVTDYSVESLGVLQVDGPFWVREAQDDDLRSVSRDLEKRCGQHLYSAFDYGPEGVRIGQVLESPEGPILRRKRIVLVAGRDEQPLGYALLESGAEGINIFSLYDTLCVAFFEQTEEKEQERIRDALFAKAAQTYREMRRHSFLYLNEEHQLAPPRLGQFFEAKAFRALVSVSLIPQWVTYLTDIWVHR